jgi:hypothetical protein
MAELADGHLVGDAQPVFSFVSFFHIRHA